MTQCVTSQSVQLKGFPKHCGTLSMTMGVLSGKQLCKTRLRLHMWFTNILCTSLFQRDVLKVSLLLRAT
jgi:hypothetical protein